MSALYYETKVAARLGISRSDFKYLRAEVLEKKIGWVMSGRDVALTQDGLDAILRHLRASSNALPDDLDFSDDRVADPKAEKKEGAATPPPLPGGAVDKSDETDETNGAAEAADAPAETGLVELTVDRIYPNTRLLRARTAQGALVDVGVRSNKNFRPFDHRGRKMTLQARLVRPGRYDMEGRCPRFPGRY